MVLQKFPGMFLDMGTVEEKIPEHRGLPKGSQIKKTSSTERVGEDSCPEGTHPLG